MFACILHYHHAILIHNDKQYHVLNLLQIGFYPELLNLQNHSLPIIQKSNFTFTLID